MLSWRRGLGGVEWAYRSSGKPSGDHDPFGGENNPAVAGIADFAHDASLLELVARRDLHKSLASVDPRRDMRPGLRNHIADVHDQDLRIQRRRINSTGTRLTISLLGLCCTGFDRRSVGKECV